MTEATLAKKPAQAASGATLHERILVGFKPIDDLHKEFEEIVGVLNAPGEADFGEHLLALHEHMLRHAAIEEGFMAQERYAHLGRHRRAHEHLLEAIARVRDRWDCGDVEAVRRFAAELMSWFAIHASSEDAELVAYLKGGAQPA